MTDFAELGVRYRGEQLVRGKRETEQFAQTAKVAGQETETLGRRARATDRIFGDYGGSANRAGAAMRTMAAAAAAAAAALGALFVGAISEARTFESAMFRMEAVIAATGGAADRSADQLRQQARDLALATLESTEGVLQAQQVLLTFRNVQGDIFDRAIESAADMAAALGGDLQSSTMQLAKALENPNEGLTALTRSGTVFTQAQKDMVKAMVEAGDTAAAQTFILDELEAQYGGVAEAAAGGLAGAQDTLGQRFQELKLELADQLNLLELATAAVNFFADAVRLATGVIRGIGEGVRAITDLLHITERYTAAERAAAEAVEMSRAAMESQGSGMVALASSTSGLTTLTQDSAAAKLAEAEAIYMVMLGRRADAMAAAMQTDAYRDLAREHERLEGMSRRGLRQTLPASVIAEDPDARNYIDNLEDQMVAMVNEAAKLPDGVLEAYDALQLMGRALEESRSTGENINDVLARMRGTADGVAPPIERASGAARGLSGSLGQAGAMAGMLVARLGQVPAAIAGMAGQVDAAVGALAQQNRTLQYQVNEGLTSTAAGIRAQGDEALDTLARHSGAALDRMGDGVQASFNEAARQAETLGLANEALTQQLSNMNSAAAEADGALDDVGGGVGSGAGAGSAGAAADRMGELATMAETAGTMLADAAEEADAAQEAFAGLGVEIAGGLLDSLRGGDVGSFFDDIAGRARSSFDDVFASILGGTQTIGGAFSSAMGNLTGGIGGLFSGGGMASLGTAISGALPIIGAATTAIDLIKGFSSSSVIGSGFEGQIGGGNTFANSYESTRSTSFWGLSSSRSTDKDFAADETNALRSAVAITREQIGGLAESIGADARRMTRLRHEFKIDTDGMSAEQVAAALNAEAEAHRELSAQAVLGTQRYTEVGETAVDTLGRLSTSLGTFNDVARVLGQDALPKTIAGAARAASILESVGGAGALQSGVSSYMGNILSDSDRREIMRQQFNRQARAIGVRPRNINDRDEFQSAVEGLGERGNYAAQAGLLGLTSLFDGIESIEDASRRAADAARDAAAAQDEGLRKRLLALRGEEGVDALRKMEMDTVSGLGRVYLERIYRLEDDAEATRDATAAADDAQRRAEARANAIDPEDYRNQMAYATAYDRARAGAGMIGTRPEVYIPPGSVPSGGGDSRTGGAVMTEIRDILRSIAVNVSENGGNTADLLQKFDRIGLGVRA